MTSNTKVKECQVEEINDEGIPHICQCKENYTCLDLRSGELTCMICKGNIPVESVK